MKVLESCMRMLEGCCGVSTWGLLGILVCQTYFTQQTNSKHPILAATATAAKTTATATLTMMLQVNIINNIIMMTFIAVIIIISIPNCYALTAIRSCYS